MGNEQAPTEPVSTDTIMSVKTEHDHAWNSSSKGTYRRITVGKRGADISGALYLRNNTELPKAILILLDPK